MNKIGVYCMLRRFFELHDRGLGSEREVTPEEFVELIKKHSPKYEKLKFSTCIAMFMLSHNPLYEKRHPLSCRGRDWVAVRAAYKLRGDQRDYNSVLENEADYVYHTIVTEADELKKAEKEAVQSQSASA